MKEIKVGLYRQSLRHPKKGKSYLINLHGLVKRLFYDWLSDYAEYDMRHWKNSRVCFVHSFPNAQR